MMAKFKFVDAVKWLATVIQLIGYGMTGLNLIPYNIYMFFVGIFLWFAVGFMWKDRAIMVVHVGAFISLLIGYLNAQSHVEFSVTFSMFHFCNTYKVLTNKKIKYYYQVVKCVKLLSGNEGGALAI